MEDKNQISEMIEALKDAIEVQKKYEEALETLRKENQILSDTILANKLGKAATERRELLGKIEEEKERTKSAIEEAEAVKTLYDQRLDKLTLMIKEFKIKQENLDTYIDEEVNKRISNR